MGLTVTLCICDNWFALIGLRSIVMSTSICLSVHSRNSKIMSPNFTNFFVHVACGLGSVLL